MKDHSLPTSIKAVEPNRGNRWNPVLPFSVSLLGSLTFIFASGTTLLGALSTFGLSFVVAYITQIVFARFFIALPLLTAVPTHNHDSQPEKVVG
jgi:hypothetical protein